MVVVGTGVVLLARRPLSCPCVAAGHIRRSCTHPHCRESDSRSRRQRVARAARRFAAVGVATIVSVHGPSINGRPVDRDCRRDLLGRRRNAPRRHGHLLFALPSRDRNVRALHYQYGDEWRTRNMQLAHAAVVQVACFAAYGAADAAPAQRFDRRVGFHLSRCLWISWNLFLSIIGDETLF